MALQTDKLYHSKTPWAPCQAPSAHSPEKPEGKVNNLPVRDATNSDGPAVYQCWTLAICGIHGKQPLDGCSAGFRNQVGDGLQSWRWATRSHLWGRACVSATRRTPSGQPPGMGSQVEREPPSPCREAPASSGVWSSVGASGHFCPPHGSAMAISALELAMDQQGDPWLSLPTPLLFPLHGIRWHCAMKTSWWQTTQCTPHTCQTTLTSTVGLHPTQMRNSENDTKRFVPKFYYSTIFQEFICKVLRSYKICLICLSFWWSAYNMRLRKKWLWIMFYSCHLCFAN